MTKIKRWLKLCTEIMQTIKSCKHSLVNRNRALVLGGGWGGGGEWGKGSSVRRTGFSSEILSEVPRCRFVGVA